jgi:hypothetical protein
MVKRMATFLSAVDSKLAALRAVSRLYLRQVREGCGWTTFVVSLEQVTSGAPRVKMLSTISVRPSPVVRNGEASALRTTEDSLSTGAKASTYQFECD